MRLFGGGYDKPGKGIDKNAPKKKGFFLFFDILIRKFGKFLGANCLYTMTSIIWIFMLYIFAAVVFAGTGIAENIAASMGDIEGFDAQQVQGSIMVMLQLMFAVGIFVLWGAGPASAAYAYTNRCFTREEHAWVLSDAIDKFKENFKQGMLVVIIDAIVLIFGLNAMYFYHTLYTSTGSIIWMTLTYITGLIMFIYTMMHPYLYQIMVTFKCSIGSLYKNALLMTLAKLPGNFFVTLLSIAVMLILFITMNPLIAAIIMGVFGLCLTRYAAEFYAARVIERSILKDIEKKQPEIEYLEEEE